MKTIPTAQNSSEYVPPPKTCANVGTVSAEVPGVVTGVAWEMIRVRPSNVNNVPRVVTNDEIPRADTASPLNKPMSMATISAQISAGMSGRPTLALSL